MADGYSDYHYQTRPVRTILLLSALVLQQYTPVCNNWWSHRSRYTRVLRLSAVIESHGLSIHRVTLFNVVSETQCFTKLPILSSSRGYGKLFAHYLLMVPTTVNIQWLDITDGKSVVNLKASAVLFYCWYPWRHPWTLRYITVYRGSYLSMDSGRD